MESKVHDFPQELQEVAHIHKALSHPARLAIIELLEEVQSPVLTSDIVKSIPLARGTVLQHLTILKDHGIVETVSLGNQTAYQLQSHNVRINTSKVISHLQKITTTKIEQNGSIEKILFLCTENSCRSQMAEAFLRYHRGERFIDSLSAGMKPAQEIHWAAKVVMEERGIPLTNQYPKDIKTYIGKESIPLVIFVCANAEEDCPYHFPFARRKIAMPIENPADSTGSKEEILTEFRRIRDIIENKIKLLLEEIPLTKGPLQ